jgi:thiamine-monophosphate kinase
MPLVKDLGEQGLLAKLHQFCPSEIVGDDAAVITTSPDKKLVVTTDVLVEGVHFSDRTTPPFSVGWRAAAANLSDLAAMGASPLGITVGLSLRGDMTVSWVENLYQGMKQCLDQYHTKILGGDLCRSPVVTVAITALGEVSPHQVITRKAAKPGDVIVITGFHGLARAGLELLLHPELANNLPRECQQSLILAHQQPQPRLDVLAHLGKITSRVQVAGMDSSDGLADAIVQICRCSGVGAEIDRNSIPVSSDILELVSGEQALQWALYGGEDFELVLCLPEDSARLLINQLDAQAAIIGKVISEQQITLVDPQKVHPKLLLSQTQSFQHF